MDDIKKGRTIIIWTVSVLFSVMFLIAIVALKEVVQLRNYTQITINKKFDLSKAKKEELSFGFSGSGNSNRCYYRISEKKAKTLDDKIATTLDRMLKYIKSKQNFSREVHFAFGEYESWICNDVIIDYYLYGQKGNFLNTPVENVVEIKTRNNKNFLKKIISKKGKIIKSDFPITKNKINRKSSSIGTWHNFVQKNEPPVYVDTRTFVYYPVKDKNDLINIAIRTALNINSRISDVIQVAITDLENINYALVVVKYYPKGYDENKEKVENTLEVYVKDPNIDPFNVFYVQKR
ncbi:hypothetical protein AAEX28_08525 [Lentisphaerota bacterium WC36G]|nr:hypothetical protein LJT99_11380 [Lentisphaerae bacterium WC36]